MMLFRYCYFALASAIALDAVAATKDVDQVVVRYHTPPANNQLSAMSATSYSIQSGTEQSRLTYQKELGAGGAAVFSVENLDSDDVQELEEVMKAQDSNVISVEPDVRMYPVSSEPSDLLFGYQWNLFGSDRYGVNPTDAWSLESSERPQVVAVVDSGILFQHEDLSPARMLDGYDFISNSDTANDGDGRDSDPSDMGNWISSAESNGVVFNGCPVVDSNWHGTHVAGIIAATANNLQGIAGVSNFSQILPIRVLGKCGGRASDVADAIMWAAGADIVGVPSNPTPASVINLSLGSSQSCMSYMQDAIDVANELGAIVVVAAGNDGIDASNFQPASCSGVITVGAHDFLGNLSSFSNFGSSLTLTAPGGGTLESKGIWSTGDGGKTIPLYDDAYLNYAGTSMATPHVAATVAMMRSIEGGEGIDHTKVKAVLQKTSEKHTDLVGCSAEQRCGSGRLNTSLAIRALSELAPAKYFEVFDIGEGSYQLSWRDVSEINDGYVLQTRENAEVMSEVTLSGADLEQWTEQDVQELRSLTYRLYASNGSELGADFAELEYTPPLRKPQGLNVFEARYNRVTLSWQNFSSAYDYVEVYRSANGTNYALIGQVDRGESSFIDEEVYGGRRFYYKVRARSYAEPSRSSVFSNVVIADTSILPPTNMSLELVNLKDVQITWDETDTGVYGYAIERAVEFGAFTEIARVGASLQSYTDRSTIDGRLYHYRVKSFFGGIMSSASNQASIQLDLSKPEQLKSSLISNDEGGFDVRLKWIDKSFSETGYQIEKRDGSDNLIEVISLQESSSEYLDTDVITGQSYFYSVIAIKDDVSSAVEGPVPVLVDVIIPDSISVAESDEGVLLSWEDNNTSASYYVIERAVNQGEFEELVKLGADQKQFEDTQLIDGNLYQYRIVVGTLDQSFSSGESLASHLSELVSPEEVVVTYKNSSHIEVRWQDKSESEQFYQIERSENGGPYKWLTNDPENRQVHRDYTAIDGRSYRYRVRPINDRHMGDFVESSEIVLQLLAPTDMSASSLDFSVDLMWEIPSRGEESVFVERSMDNVQFELIATLPAGTSQYRDAKLSPMTTYYYRVYVGNSSGQSLYSKVAKVTTKDEIGALSYAYLMALVAIVAIRRKRISS